MASFEKKQGILQHLQEQLNYVTNELDFDPDKIVGIFLYGSQNYGFDSASSDIDSKVVIVPNFEDLCLNQNIISAEYSYMGHEYIDVKDVRLYRENLMKQSINYVETLFTDYYLLNPTYEDIFNEYFFGHRKSIAHYNCNRTVQAAGKQALHTIGKETFTQKDIYNAARLYIFLQFYVRGASYEKCIQPTGVEQVYLWELKYGTAEADHDPDFMMETKSRIEKGIQEILEDAELGGVPPSDRRDAQFALDTGTVEIVRRGCKEEIQPSATKEEFLNALTAKETEAYYQIANETHGKGHIVISQMINKYGLSRSVYNSTLKKMEHYQIAKVQNAGVSGMEIVITQGELRQEAKGYDVVMEGYEDYGEEI